MSVKDLLPWRQKDRSLPELSDPFLTLHREVNRLFENALRDFGSPWKGLASLQASWPSLEIEDGEKEIRVTAEVPGMDEKDIEILLSDGVLTLKGEKQSEKEDKDRRYSERYYGRFERRIPLGYEIDEDKVDASFKNGVLTIVLPKSKEEQSKVRRISIKG